MNRLNLAGIMLLLVFTMFGCKKKENGEPSTGTVRVYLTDDPIDADKVAGVYITVKEINIRVNNEWETLDGFNGPKKFDLLTLTDTTTAFLGTETLPAGNYTEVRFVLDAVEENGSNASNPGCYIQFKDSSTQPLFVPSGSSSGFKAKGDFTVPINGTVDIVADFDVRKSIVVAGNSGKYLLKPVIHITARNQAGSITGAVTDTANHQTLVVYAYQNNDYVDTEDDEPAIGNPRFPNAVTSDKVENGKYELYFLAAGTYDLAVAEYDTAGTFISTIGFVKDISVGSGGIANGDFNTANLSATP